MRRPVLIVMVKEPRAGRVKTRLGADIGMTNAAWWYRHQTRALLRNLRDPRWQIVLSVAPDRALGSSFWPADLPRVAQGKGDIGDRMGRALRHSFGPTVLIGSDVSTVTKPHVSAAFDCLRTHETVIGPAIDGGFWLIGLRHPDRAPATLFQNVPWSHKDTLKHTLPTLPGRVAMAATLSDVDTAADLA